MQFRVVMLRRPWRTSVALAALIAHLGLAPRAHAGHKTREQRETEARHACSAGQVEVGIDLLAGLLTEYWHANYIYNQARCYQQNRRPEEAISRFKEYLRVAVRPTPDEQARIERFIHELEAEVAAAPPPAPPVAADHAQPLGPAAVAASASAPTLPISRTAPPRRAWILPAAGIAVGVAGVVTGVIASLQVRSLSNQVEQAGYGDFTSQTLARQAASAHRFEALQWAGYGIGGAALASSIIYLAVGARDERAPRTAVAVNVGPGGTPSGVTLAGRF
jgi:hypothetical protein